MRSPDHRLRTLIRSGAAAVLVMLSGCATGTPGTATTSPYQAPGSTAITATELVIPKGAIGVSQDGTTIAVQTKDRVCLVPRTTPTTTGVCATLPTGSGRLLATFSPSGSQVALQQNYQLSYQGGLWIADAKTGALRKVKVVSGGAGSSADPSADGSATRSTDAGDSVASESSSATSDATTRSSSTTTSTRPGAATDAVYQLTWAATGQLIGTGPETLIVIDPQRATATVVARTTSFINWMVAGQSRVLVQLADDQELVAVDLPDGRIHAVPLSGKAGYFPIAVSPDGTHALFGPNPGLYATNVSPKLVNLDSGVVTEVPGIAEHEAIYAAAYSPDNSALALIVHEPQDGQKVRVLTMPAAGGSPHLAGTGTHPPFVVIWTTHNRLIPSQQVQPGSSAYTLHG
ncbi:MAG: hypothetical protein ACR2P2_19855 [Nakamurella sp.]